MSKLDIVLLTGISGSGKSVALNALEDAGYFCVDNLPPELLSGLIVLEEARDVGMRRRVAVAVDVRSAGSLPHLMPVLQELQQDGHKVRSVFLDASTDALVRRFSDQPQWLRFGLPANDSEMTRLELALTAAR